MNFSSVWYFVDRIAPAVQRRLLRRRITRGSWTPHAITIDREPVILCNYKIVIVVNDLAARLLRPHARQLVPHPHVRVALGLELLLEHRDPLLEDRYEDGTLGR